MERQAGFVLVALLFLANVLTTEAETTTIKGPGMVVDVGAQWSVSCVLKEGEKLEWTRNGISLDSEIRNRQLVNATVDGNEYMLVSRNASMNDNGVYKCSADSDASVPVTVRDSGKKDVSPVISTTSATDTSPINSKPMATDSSFKIIANNKHLNLSCTNKTSWMKDDHNVTWLKNNDKEFKLHNDGTLEILQATKNTYGNYTCKDGKQSTSFTIVPKLISNMVETVSVTEGERLLLECTAPNYGPPEFTWFFHNKSYPKNDDGRINITTKEEVISGNTFIKSVLNIANITMDDSGEVSCIAQYPQIKGFENSNHTSMTDVRVKDKYAALWPFLGICVEVIVLCAIILVYEKKRNKAELDESDTDQSPDTKPIPNKDSDVRQRK